MYVCVCAPFQYRISSYRIGKWHSSLIIKSEAVHNTNYWNFILPIYLYSEIFPLLLRPKANTKSEEEEKKFLTKETMKRSKSFFRNYFIFSFIVKSPSRIYCYVIVYLCYSFFFFGLVSVFCCVYPLSRSTQKSSRKKPPTLPSNRVFTAILSFTATEKMKVFPLIWCGSLVCHLDAVLCVGFSTLPIETKIFRLREIPWLLRTRAIKSIALIIIFFFSRKWVKRNIDQRRKNGCRKTARVSKQLTW